MAPLSLHDYFSSSEYFSLTTFSFILATLIVSYRLLLAREFPPEYFPATYHSLLSRVIYRSESLILQSLLVCIFSVFSLQSSPLSNAVPPKVSPHSALSPLLIIVLAYFFPKAYISWRPVIYHPFRLFSL